MMRAGVAVFLGGMDVHGCFRFCQRSGCSKPLLHHQDFRSFPVFDEDLRVDLCGSGRWLCGAHCSHVQGPDYLAKLQVGAFVEGPNLPWNLIFFSGFSSLQPFCLASKIFFAISLALGPWGVVWKRKRTSHQCSRPNWCVHLQCSPFHLIGGPWSGIKWKKEETNTPTYWMDSCEFLPMQVLHLEPCGIWKKMVSLINSKLVKKPPKHPKWWGTLQN